MSLQRAGWVTWLVAMFGLACVSRTPVYADLFGSGVNAFEIDFVTIGEPGNPKNLADVGQVGPPIGSVAYVYRMGQYEISTEMIEKANAATAGSSNPLQITHDLRDTPHPATGISWIEAAKFVNWLNISSGHAPAYKFEDIRGIDPPPPNAVLDGFTVWAPSDPGYDPANQYRNQMAFYFLPGFNEWYKAAFYRPGTGLYNRYPTGQLIPNPVPYGTEPNSAVYEQRRPQDTGPADVTNAGGWSAFGTMAQGGNAYELIETSGIVNSNPFAVRTVSGGSWLSDHSSLSWRGGGGVDAHTSSIYVGFRVASVPEPAGCSLVFAILGLIYLGRVRSRRFSITEGVSYGFRRQVLEKDG